MDNTNASPLQWRVELFGNLQVVGTPGSLVVRQFRTRRAALLLAYLALKPGTVKSRSQLCEMLWPEADPQSQQNRLRFELSALRASLGGTLFATDCGKTAVALASTVGSDVADFDHLVTRSARLHAADQRLPLLRQAVALYRGELLPGVDLPDDCPPEYDWLSLERNRLHQAASRAAGQLIADLGVLGLHAEAIDVRQKIDSLLPNAVEQRSESSVDVDRTALKPMARQQPVAAYTASPPVSLLQGPFFGRETELLRLRQWAAAPIANGEASATATIAEPENGFSEPRLLTVLGPGGMGKTRIVLEGLVGRADSILIACFSASDERQIYEAIALTLSLPRRPHVPIQNQVVEALRVRSACILVLDNCEHLLTACANCVRTLLHACPHLRVAATSQHALMVEDEETLTLAPLSSREARNLFLSRVEAVQPAFALTPSTRAVAEEIADLLGGVPLALELAAARAIVLGPHEMQEQLRRQLDFLASPHPGRPSRHRSMRAVLEWSLGLLSDKARRALAFLSLFRTSASLEAIQAALGEDAPPLDALEELRLYSLLIVRIAGGESRAGTRYDVLPYVRDFAAQQLPVPERHLGWDRMARFWTQQLATVPNAFQWGKWDAIRAMLVPDLENIRAAITGCAERGLGAALYRLTDELGTVFLEMGYWDDAAALLRYTEDAGPHSLEHRIRLLGLEGALDRRRGNEDQARRAWENRLLLARDTYDADLEATILFDLAGQAIDTGQFAEAQTFIDAGAGVAAQASLAYRLVVGHVLRARLGLAQQQPEAAAWAETAWASCAQENLNPSRLLYVLIHLLPVFRSCGNNTRVGELVERGLPLAIKTGQAFLLARLLDDAACYWEEQGLWQAAALGFFIAYAIHTELGSRFAEASQQAWEHFQQRHALQEGIHLPENQISHSSVGVPAPTWQHAVERLHLFLS